MSCLVNQSRLLSLILIRFPEHTRNTLTYSCLYRCTEMVFLNNCPRYLSYCALFTSRTILPVYTFSPKAVCAELMSLSSKTSATKGLISDRSIRPNRVPNTSGSNELNKGAAQGFCAKAPNASRPKLSPASEYKLNDGTPILLNSFTSVSCLATAKTLQSRPLALIRSAAKILLM